MAVKDRIKSLQRVRAGDLVPNPRNWRTHPDAQIKAVAGVLDEIGYADALLARELPDGKLELVDGHLRADLDPDQEVPVLVLDIDEDEAAKLLTVLDPLAGMAGVDEEKLTELLAEFETENESLQGMLDELAMSVEPFEMPADADGKEFDESCADDVEMMECPSCGHKFPK